MMRLVLILCFLVFAFPALAAEGEAFERYAFARCVMQGYGEGAVKADAAKMAWAELEAIKHQPEMVQAIEQLVTLYLTQEKEPAATPIERCTELMQGKALKRVLEESARLQMG